MAGNTVLVSNDLIYTFIGTFLISVIVFLLNEWGKRQYLIYEKNYTLRLERFELLLQDLYTHASIYLDIQMILKIEIVYTPEEELVKTQSKLIMVNRFLGKIHSANILDESNVLKATTHSELKNQKWTLMNFIQKEGLNVSNNIQVKASSLHLITPDKKIQSEANKITENLIKYITEADVNKDYSSDITKDLENLVDSMKTYLPSYSYINFLKVKSKWIGFIVGLICGVPSVLIYKWGFTG